MASERELAIWTEMVRRMKESQNKGDFANFATPLDFINNIADFIEHRKVSPEEIETNGYAVHYITRAFIKAAAVREIINQNPSVEITEDMITHTEEDKVKDTEYLNESLTWSLASAALAYASSTPPEIEEPEPYPGINSYIKKGNQDAIDHIKRLMGIG